MLQNSILHKCSHIQINWEGLNCDNKDVFKMANPAMCTSYTQMKTDFNLCAISGCQSCPFSPPLDDIMLLSPRIGVTL